MLYCEPKWQYFEDEQGKPRFRKLRLKIWDDKDYFDPVAVRRLEEYEDIEEAIARLDEFGAEPSFDRVSRTRASALAKRLRKFEQDGILPRLKGPSQEELQAALNRAFDKLARSSN